MHTPFLPQSFMLQAKPIVSIVIDNIIITITVLRGKSCDALNKEKIATEFMKD